MVYTVPERDDADLYRDLAQGDPNLTVAKRAAATARRTSATQPPRATTATAATQSRTGTAAELGFEKDAQGNWRKPVTNGAPDARPGWKQQPDGSWVMERNYQETVRNPDGSTTTRQAAPLVSPAGKHGQTATQAAPPATPAEDPRTAGPGTDQLRKQVITGEWNPQHQKRQVGLINGATVAQPKAIAGTDLTGARAYAGQAAGNVGQIQMGTVEDIAGTDLSRARAALDAYRNSIGDVRLTEQHQRVANPLTHDPSAEAQRARALTMQGLETAHSAPDRTDLALRSIELARQRAEPAMAERMRQVAQRAAALGRTRAGMTTNDLTGLEQDERNRDYQLREAMLIDAGEKTLADRLNLLGASQSVGSQFRGEDMQEAGFEQGLRNETRGERGFWAGLDSERARLAATRSQLMDTVTGRETEQANIVRRDNETDREYRARQEQARAQAAAMRAAELRQLAGQEAGFAGVTRRDAESDRDIGLRVAEGNANRDLERASALGRIDTTNFGAETQLRDELRGERGYLNDQAQQAIRNRIEQAELEDRLLTNDTNRQVTISDAQIRAGDNTPLINAYLAAVQTYGPDSSEAQDLAFRLFGTQRAQA